MNTDAGKALAKRYEGCILFAYDDKFPFRVAEPKHTIFGTLTIGYGHTGPDVHPGLIWTQEQADAAFEDDWNKVIDGIGQLYHGPLPLLDNQMSALGDLAFNIGANAFAHSYTLGCLNKGDYFNAASGFMHFTHAFGAVNTDLIRRRTEEISLFRGASPNAAKIITTADLNAQELSPEAPSAAS